MKKLIVSLLVVVALGTTVLVACGATASAISHTSKPEKLAELTGKTVAEIINERHTTNKTYGEIAKEYGVLDEFQNCNHEYKQNKVHELVDNGTITEEEGATILQRIEDQQANCDGTGYQNHSNPNHAYHYSNHDQNHSYYHSQENNNYSQHHNQNHIHHNR